MKEVESVKKNRFEAKIVDMTLQISGDEKIKPCPSVLFHLGF